MKYLLVAALLLAFAAFGKLIGSGVGPAEDERRAQAEQQAGEIVRKAREDAAREHERVMEQAKGEISELMSAAAEKLVLSSTSDAYDKFLDTAEERKDNG